MNRFVLAGLLVAAVGCSSEESAKKKEASTGSGDWVVLDEFKAEVPASWKQQAPLNAMRLTQFVLPRVEGDRDDAELVIFKGIGGSADDNIKRWKEQMAPPEGKTLDDIAKVDRLKVGPVDVAYLDIAGTYLYKANPAAPTAERRPDYRMLGVVFESKRPYHIKLTGPAKTVAHYKQGFDDWLKAFK